MTKEAAQHVLDTVSFERCMAAFGPFEARPHVAIGVSGGGDSMALCLLAADWARRRGGMVTGLTVDHGLREGSAAEARQVGRWLESRGISHAVLEWKGPKPTTRRQEAAREARYRLMEAWCRGAGVLHLLVAHTREDQWETVFMRVQRATGAEGLAGMGAVVERDHLRVLRPLLNLRRDSLRVWLRALGQPWIEDPSNEDVGYARVRARRVLAETAGLAAPMAVISVAAGLARQCLETAATGAAMRLVRMHPAGFAWLETAAFQELAEPLQAVILARLAATVGGAAYRPRRASVDRALAGLRTAGGGKGATLAGCRLVPSRNGLLLACREGRNLPWPMPFRPGADLMWDGRFSVFATPGREEGRARWLAPLGRTGWVEVLKRQDAGGRTSLPKMAGPTLPALWDEGGILEVPHMAYRREGGRAEIKEVRFRPMLPLAAAGFRLAPGAACTM